MIRLPAAYSHRETVDTMVVISVIVCCKDIIKNMGFPNFLAIIFRFL